MNQRISTKELCSLVPKFTKGRIPHAILELLVRQGNRSITRQSLRRETGAWAPHESRLNARLRTIRAGIALRSVSNKPPWFKRRVQFIRT